MSSTSMGFDEARTLCAGCGATREGGAETCRFCEHRHDDNLELVATMCWGCKTWSALDWQKQACPKCGVVLWVNCLQCKQDTPHHLKQCIHCGSAP